IDEAFRVWSSAASALNTLEERQCSNLNIVILFRPSTSDSPLPDQVSRLVFLLAVLLILLLLRSEDEDRIQRSPTGPFGRGRSMRCPASSRQGNRPRK